MRKPGKSQSRFARKNVGSIRWRLLPKSQQGSLEKRYSRASAIGPMRNEYSIVSIHSHPPYRFSNYLASMSNNYYEELAQAIVEQSAHDKRSQPWKCTVKTEATHSTTKGEWYEVAGYQAADNHGVGVDIRKHAFPMGEVDVRTNVFPMGEVSVLTHAFPMVEPCVGEKECSI
jgi:hypothetical protein